MLYWLTKRLRVRAAITMAALYAFCVLAPPVALAFANGMVAAHCLTDDHHGAAHKHAAGHAHEQRVAHVHADGVVNTHDDRISLTGGTDDHTSTVGSCCGLFCFAAAIADLPGNIGQPIQASSVPAALNQHLAGRDPETINRPP